MAHRSRHDVLRVLRAKLADLATNYPSSFKHTTLVANACPKKDVLFSEQPRLTVAIFDLTAFRP